MKTIKINLKYWGYGIDNFLVRMLKKDFNMIICDNPDYLIFSTDCGSKSNRINNLSNSGNFNLKSFIKDLLKKSRIFSDYIIMRRKTMPEMNTKAKKIFFSPANCIPNMNKCDWAITCDYPDIKSDKHFVIPWYKFYSNAGEELIKKDNYKDDILKTKFCNFVYSNNTPFRNKFYKKLSKYKKVDALGNAMNKKNKKIVLSLPEKDMAGWEKEKIEMIKPYKFTIAFEGKYGWAVSEKIYDAMRADTIPIYYGNPDVEKDFNTKSFVNYHDFEKEIKNNIPYIFLELPIIKYIINRLIIEPIAIKRMIKKIIEIDNDDKLYEKYLNEPWYNDNKLPDSLNENIIRNKLKEIFS